MNYIREIESFEDWLEINYLPPTAQLLWYKLLVLCNRAGWAEWLSVTNQALMAKIGVLSEKTFIDTRNKLKQAGLIDFKSGKKGEPTRYKLFSVEEILQKIHCKKYSVKNTGDTTVYPTVKTTVYPTVNPTVKDVANAEISSVSEEAKHKHKHKQYISSCCSNSSTDWEKIQDAWDNNIHPMTPIERENLLSWLDELPADVILLAIKEAVKANVRTMRYIDGILVNWHSNGLITTEAVLAYKRDKEDEKKGKPVKRAAGLTETENDLPEWLKNMEWRGDSE